MEHKHGRLRTMMMLAAVLLGFVGVPVGLAPGLTDTQSNDVKAAGVVPAPPSSCGWASRLPTTVIRSERGWKFLYQWLHAETG